MKRTKRDSGGANTLDAFELELGGEDLVVISAPARGTSVRVASLTPAEQAVVSEVLSGRSNAEIAAHRNSSPQTIANQLAAVFRKVGVVSRAELAVRLVDDED